MEKLPDNTVLVKDLKFYSDMADKTRIYLTAVYPTAKETFEKMGYINLAVFYNSLWMYYNCKASFDKYMGDNGPDDVQSRHCWQELPGCGKSIAELPYSPQGYLLSYDSWVNENFTPWIYSDSTIDPSKITSFAPGGPIWFWTVGPSQMFGPQRVILRYVYNTTLPDYVQWMNNYGVERIMKQPSLLPGATGQWESDWNYPNNWWAGVPNGGYIEVTGSAEPGDPLSVTAIWLNGLPGSGVFYNVGNSFVCRNKVDCVFQFVKMMNKKDDGMKALKAAYNVVDPYDIVAILMNTVVNQVPPLVWNKVTKTKMPCNWNPGATNSMESIPSDRNGWNTVVPHAAVDWYEWCPYENEVAGRSSFGIANKCIDDIILGRTYVADRIAAQGPFDEAMTWMGVFLGYDSVQETQSSNGSGFYQFEILHLRDLPSGVKNRDYSDYIMSTVSACDRNFSNVAWRDDAPFFVDYMKKFYTYLSLRDPTDVNNDSKATKCLVPVPWSMKNLSADNQFNITCKNNLSDMYTNLSVFGTGTWNQCSPDGVGAGKKPMTGPDVWPSS